MKKIIFVLGLMLSAFLVYGVVDFDDPDTIYGDPMTLEEFKLLNDSELINWTVEFRGTEDYYTDVEYYYYMNVFDYWLDDNGNETVTPVRDTFVIRCDEMLYNCTVFYAEQLLESQDAFYYYFKELQE